MTLGALAAKAPIFPNFDKPCKPKRLLIIPFGNLPATLFICSGKSNSAPAWPKLGSSFKLPNFSSYLNIPSSSSVANLIGLISANSLPANVKPVKGDPIALTVLPKPFAICLANFPYKFLPFWVANGAAAAVKAKPGSALSGSNTSSGSGFIWPGDPSGNIPGGISSGSWAANLEGSKIAPVTRAAFPAGALNKVCTKGLFKFFFEKLINLSFKPKKGFAFS